MYTSTVGLERDYIGNKINTMYFYSAPSLQMQKDFGKLFKSSYFGLVMILVFLFINFLFIVTSQLYHNFRLYCSAVRSLDYNIK